MTKGAQNLAGLRRSGRAIRRGESGVVMMEFALVLPILVVMFIGLVEFTEAFTVTRKLAAVANTVSDLVAQETTVTDADLDDISLIGDQLIKPYSATPMSLIIVSVVSDIDNKTTVAWAYPPTAYVAGADFNLPQADMMGPNSSLILTEATYDFTPTVAHFLGTFNITERSYFKPRMTPLVAKTD